MHRFFVGAVLLASTVISAPALAQDAPALTCVDLIIPINGVPAETVLSFTVPSAELIKQCTSATGAPLSVVTPDTGVFVNPRPDSSQIVPFTVQDNNGNSATANVIITRN